MEHGSTLLRRIGILRWFAVLEGLVHPLQVQINTVRERLKLGQVQNVHECCLGMKTHSWII